MVSKCRRLWKIQVGCKIVRYCSHFQVNYLGKFFNMKGFPKTKPFYEIIIINFKFFRFKSNWLLGS